MERGTRYLASSAVRAALAANARKPLAEDGVGAVAAFAAGLATSELPAQHAALFAASAATGVARGVHKTKGGKLGLALTAGSAAALWKMHQSTADSDERVELALCDQLGPDYQASMTGSPMPARDSKLPLMPSPAARKRYLHDGHVEYGEFGRRTTLDVWRRPDIPVDANAPVLIQVHGGAWIVGDKEGQAYPLMSHMAERGWVCVSITYRLSPKSTWPDHIVDVKRAISWVKENIAEHGGNPDWLAITGGSAGGHLCSLAALTPNDPQFQPGFEDADTTVHAAVPFYGVYDWINRDSSGSNDLMELLEERVVKQSAEAAPEIYDQASPMSHVDADTLPMMLVHGTNDTLVPVTQARSMVDMLRRESSNPVVYVEFPGAQHAFDVFGSRRTTAVVGGIERFLNTMRARAEAPAHASSTT